MYLDYMAAIKDNCGFIPVQPSSARQYCHAQKPGKHLLMSVPKIFSRKGRNGMADGFCALYRHKAERRVRALFYLSVTGGHRRPKLTGFAGKQRKNHV